MLLLLLACEKTTEEPNKQDSAPVGQDSGVTEGEDSPTGGDSAPSGDSGGDSDTTLAHVEWDSACNPLATGNDCFLPFPSTWHTTPDASTVTGVRLAYSSDDFWSPDGDVPIDISIFNLPDGVSPIGQALVNFGVDIHPDFLWGLDEDTASLAAGAAIALINIDTGERVPLLTEMDQTNRDLDYEGRHALIIRPVAPMDFGGRYMVVLTQALTDTDGQALTSPPVFAALRDGVITDDATIEAMRPQFDELFRVAEEVGYPREQMLLAWEFQVASEDYVMGPIRSAREQTLEIAATDGISYVIEEVEQNPTSNAALIVKGTFYPPSFIDADSTLVRDGNTLVLQSDTPGYPFTMVVPPAVLGQTDVPLVIFGHGIFGTGRDYLDGSAGETYIQPLAQEMGAVVIATDWIGLSGSDLELIVTEIIPDITRFTLITDRLVQSLVNNLALTEMALDSLQYDPQLTAVGTPPVLDPEAVYYYGVSLGGIQGSSFTSISPRISRSVLAVPGASWSNMIQRSTNFTPIEGVIDAFYPDPLTQVIFISMLQSYFDHSDPVNLARFMFDDPDYPMERAVVLQEAIGDCQVPNLATNILIRSIGASHLDYVLDPIDGVGLTTGPTTEPVVTQIAVTEALASYTPPDENNIPDGDNGVHNSAILTTSAFNQIGELFATGEIVHPCDKACDPE